MGLAVAKKKQGNSFANALKKTSTKAAPKSKKSSVPFLEDVPKEIQIAVERFVDAKKEENMAKAEKESAGKMIIDHIRPHQDKEGRSGMFRHSYGVKGDKGSQVKFISTNRWSINAEDAGQLQELLGNSFDDLITTKFEVSLKPEIFQNEELQSEFMELIGEDFDRFFDTKESLKATEGFDQRIYNAIEEKDLPALRIFCRQYKPSLR